MNNLLTIIRDFSLLGVFIGKGGLVKLVGFWVKGYGVFGRGWVEGVDE